MGRAERIARAADQLVELRLCARNINDRRECRRINAIAEQLRVQVGESIPKTRAAWLLGVSVTALDAWITRGAIPVVAIAGNTRSELVADPILDLAIEMRALSVESRKHAPVATALKRLEKRRASVRSILEAAELIEAVAIIAAATSVDGAR